MLSIGFRLTEKYYKNIERHLLGSRVLLLKASFENNQRTRVGTRRDNPMIILSHMWRDVVLNILRTGSELGAVSWYILTTSYYVYSSFSMRGNQPSIRSDMHYIALCQGMLSHEL